MSEMQGKPYSGACVSYRIKAQGAVRKIKTEDRDLKSEVWEYKSRDEKVQKVRS